MTGGAQPLPAALGEETGAASVGARWARLWQSWWRSTCGCFWWSSSRVEKYSVHCFKVWKSAREDEEYQGEKCQEKQGLDSGEEGEMVFWPHGSILKNRTNMECWIFRTVPGGKGRTSDLTPSSLAEREKTNFETTIRVKDFLWLIGSFVHSILQSRFMQIFSNLSSFRGLQTRSSFQRLVKANLRAELQRLWQRTNAVNWRLWMHIFGESASLWWRNAMPEWNDKSE